MNGRKVLMFGPNSYLDLTDHPKVIKTAAEVTRKYGTGCTGSRFLSSIFDLRPRLEKELTKLVDREDAIIYSTGFRVNLGIVSCVAGCEDYVIYDELDHVSIVEGRRPSLFTIPKSRHNNTESLKKELQKCRPDAVKLIVVDGVFSVEGDTANLSGVIRLFKKYDASIMVGGTHGLGILGNDGRSARGHLELIREVNLIMGTLSKSLTATGGLIAVDESIINYLHYSPCPYIFSASNTFAATTTVRTAFQIMKNELEHIKHLWDIIGRSLRCFRELSFEIEHTSTSIIPLYVRDTEKIFMVAKVLSDEGALIDPVIPPTCSLNSMSICFSLMAIYSKEQIDPAIGKLVRCLKAPDLL